MKWNEATLHLVLIHVVDCLLFNLTNGCSPEGENQEYITIKDKFNAADIVVLGEVYWHHKLIPNDDYYTASMHIDSTLKGPTQGLNFNVSDAGHIGGRCHQVNLKKGKCYLVFLHGIKTLQAFTEPELINIENEDTLAELCSDSGGKLPPSIHKPNTMCPLVTHCYSTVSVPSSTAFSVSTAKTRLKTPQPTKSYIPSDDHSISDERGPVSASHNGCVTPVITILWVTVINMLYTLSNRIV